MSSRSRILERALLGIAFGAIAGCGSNDRTSVAQAPPDHPSTQGTPVSPLFPGGGSPPPADPTGANYDGNAHAISEGKRLFDWYNCSGCHFHGAGGIGPSLIDSTWVYGDKIDQIYASIYQGRPNGMPSWGAKLSSTEIWELAAYIRGAAKDAENMPVPTAPPPAVPIGGAKTLDAPSPAIVDLPATTATSDARTPQP